MAVLVGCLFTRTSNEEYMKHDSLTAKELEIMNILWAFPSQRGTVHDVLNAMPEPRPAYTTVATFLKILSQKGFVKSIRKANSPQYVFEPVMSKGRYTQREMSRVKNRLFGGSLSSLVSFFVESKETSDEEIDELIELVSKLEKEKSNKH